MRRLGKDARHAWGQWLDWRRCTYSADENLRLSRYFSPLPLEMLETERESILDRARLHGEHCFDLLGSGWVRIQHGMQCRGLLGIKFPAGPAVIADSAGHWLLGRVNAANLPAARRVWRQIDDVGYVPIDWQIDFKSGYRWSERSWHAWTPIRSLPGRDVKTPWELGRCQHLPTLVWAYRLTGDQRYVRELKHQVLDFIATNPPRYGIQWRGPMDVGIRLFNWLTAWDLARSYGVTDLTFERTLAASALDHGRFLATHLEWSPTRRGNHFLAAVAGLIAAAAFLPRSPVTDAWLAFGVRQLVIETKRQFSADGANFEASTGYHRLSTELVLYSTALVLAMKEDRLAALTEYDANQWPGVPSLEPKPAPCYAVPGESGQSPFPPEHFDRLERAAEFAVWTTRPNGKVHLVGDHDSGRLLKLQPRFRRMSERRAAQRYLHLDGLVGDGQTKNNRGRNALGSDELSARKVWWDERHDDVRHLAAAAAGMFDRSDLLDCCAGPSWESELVRTLVRRRPPASQQREPLFWVDQIEGERPSPAEGPTLSLSLSAQLALLAQAPDIEAVSARIELPQRPRDGRQVWDHLAWQAWSDFGLFIWRSSRVYLAVRCGPVGQAGYGGHAHNDQLAVELMVDEQSWIADPGTFLYTPSPAIRNLWRSAAAHYVPHAIDGREPAPLDRGLFELPDTAKAETLYVGKDGFLGVHYGFGQPVWRAVQLFSSSIEITDLTDRSLPLLPPPPVSAAWPFRSPVPHAPGYGALVRP